jgi:hypothetical protein
LILSSGIAAVVIAGIVNVDSGGLLRIGVRLLLRLEFVLDADDLHLLLRHLSRLILRQHPRLLQRRDFGQFRILLSLLLFA